MKISMSQESICEEVLVSLRQIIRAISIQSKSLSVKFGITTPQLVLLKTLGKSQTLTVSKISEAINLSQATVTSIIDRLIKKELVNRSRSEVDRRKVLVTLTGKGEELVKQAPSGLQENFIKEFSKLEKWEQNQLLSSLQRISTMMNAKEIPVAPMLDENEIIS